MIYFVIGMLVAFGSIFASALVGAMFTKENIKVTTAVAAGVSLIYGVILWLSFWGTAMGIYGPTPLFAQLMIGAAIGALISVISEGEGKASLPGLEMAGILILVILVVAIFSESDMTNSEEKTALIGEIKEIKDLAKVIQPADTAHICLVSEEMARVFAQNALSEFKVEDGAIAGSRYNIGTPTLQFVDGQLWWIFPVEFQGWLKWRQDRQSPGYLRVSAENPNAEAQSVQINKAGEKLSIKYLNSACFEYKAERYLRYNGYFTSILDDWTFEVDDNWNPYYTVSVLERKHGWSYYQLKSVIVLNIQNGDFEEYTIDNLPKWVDRAYPLHVLDTNIKAWGMYKNAGWWYCLWHDDKSEAPTEGWFLVYNSQTGDCNWYSGFTSTNYQDHALTGFVLCDGRTGETTFFRTKGTTEYLIMDAAKAQWQNFGYNTSSLVPYNIYGQLTYVISMTSDNGQFVGVSLINITNTIKAKGINLDEALNAYRAEIARSGGERLAPNGGKLKSIELTGVIERIGFPRASGDQTIYYFTLQGVPKIFQATFNLRSPTVSVMQMGDNVSITYDDTQEKVITCKTFEIPSLELSEESAVLARLDESQVQVKQEEQRIKKAQDLQTLTEAMKDVDPEELQRFIEQQRQKK